jgi:hypothetical protein
VERTLRDSTWEDITALRERVMARGAASVEEAGRGFSEDLVRTFPSIVLARVFVVLPIERVQPSDREHAVRRAGGEIRPGTPVLSLLGTFGAQPSWCRRSLSADHLSIPLLSQAFVRGAPMIAKLLADLDMDLAGLDDGRLTASRKMLGGLNAAFYVDDAQSATDSRGSYVIPARGFVKDHAIRTVFGMGGAYVNGTLAVAIAFTTELLDRATVDRYPSLIANFKMATAQLLRQNRIYEPAPRP